MLHPVMGKTDQVSRGEITSVLSRSSRPVAPLAEENNAFQAPAEQTRLAIPVTISTDPRNGFTATYRRSLEIRAYKLSVWPNAT